MRRIDWYILRSFAGPFVLTFFITLFILLMQFLWKYIEDLVGKGLDWYVVTELMFYASATMVPLALPLAMLLASLMTFGNLGERFELAALKSAGISMFRFMRPAVLVGVLVTLGAWGFANYVMPKASLKFWTRLIDITQKKPALNIKPNVFYHDIEPYAILVEEKAEDNVNVRGVTIFDQSARGESHSVIVADRAQMFSVEEAGALVMRLHDGSQYGELEDRARREGNAPRTREHLRTSFAEWEMALDLSGLEMGKSNEDLYRNHYRMLNQRQLRTAMDSIGRMTRQRMETMGPVLHSYFWFRRDSTATLPALPDTASFLEGIRPAYRKGAVSRALVASRNGASFARQIEDNTRYAEDRIAQHAVEWHRKWSLSVACFVFLFVGAPLGAIIRKGGFGMPVITSVVIFVAFYVLYITGEKLADQQVWSPAFGMWFANLTLFPFSLWLTRTARNDSPLLNREAWREAWQRLRRRRGTAPKPAGHA